MSWGIVAAVGVGIITNDLGRPGAVIQVKNVNDVQWLPPAVQPTKTECVGCGAPLAEHEQTCSYCRRAIVA